MSAPGLILLDRDGVLNRMVVDLEHGTVDSPLHPAQVEVPPEVPGVLARLNAAGYGLAICSNQPAAAKGKTTRGNLEATHAAIVEGLEAAGARILSSHLCFHRAEDQCRCRKPKPALLLEALAAHPRHERSRSWMVGDGVFDVEAGSAAGLKTAFLAPRRCEWCAVVQARGLRPDFWGSSLEQFAEYLLDDNGGGRHG